MGLPQTHCDPGRVNKTPVEMAQGRLGLLLRLEAYKAELAELAIFGELEAAVGQCAEGGKELPESLLLHLEQKGHHERSWGSPEQRDRGAGSPEVLEADLR